MLIEALCLSCSIAAAPISVRPSFRSAPYVRSAPPPVRRPTPPPSRRAPVVDRSLYNTTLLVAVITATANHNYGTTRVRFRCGDEEYSRTVSRDVTAADLDSWCTTERGLGWEQYETNRGDNNGG